MLCPSLSNQRVVSLNIKQGQLLIPNKKLLVPQPPYFLLPICNQKQKKLREFKIKLLEQLRISSLILIDLLQIFWLDLERKIIYFSVQQAKLQGE